MKKSIIRFKPKLPKLSKNEQYVLKLLIEAGELVAPIYIRQENSKYLGANFYPHGVSKKEIEKAARKNPEILSPFTVVEKIDGKLKATPYHKKYASLLKPVIKKLLEAAKITENKQFAERLELQAKAFLDGSYEKATIAWMNMKPYILSIVIGPIERYDDKLFFIKTAYQAWVGVMDEIETAKATEFKNIIISSQRKILMPSEHVNFFDKIQTRVDHNILFSGLIAKFQFIGTNLPNEVELMEKYGSVISIFESSLNKWFNETRCPIFRAVFEKKFQQSYSQEGLLKGDLYNILLHEMAHSFMRYRDAEKRLGNLFPIIDEIAASVMGVKACGSLLLKEVISQKELEYILVMFVVRLFDWLDRLAKEPSLIDYIRGNAIALSFLFNSGALKQLGGISWPNFTKMFVALDELAMALDRILCMGSYEDAKKFIEIYGSLKVFENYKKPLSKLFTFSCKEPSLTS